MSASPFEQVLDSLTRQRGVSATLVASERDGIVVDARLRIGERGDRVAALAASLYRKARRSARAAGLGEVGFLQLEAANGRLCAVGRGDLVLVVVASRDANVGLIRVEMLRALELLEALA
jgi:predicted regulator of Ras-like GTPase activity (Roadblock/LC7/MglB family)